MTTATVTKTGKGSKATEALPKWPADSIEAQAIEKVRSVYRVEPGPLPAIGATPDVSLRRTELIPKAVAVRLATTRRPGFMNGPHLPDGSARDGELLGALILDGMRVVADAFGRDRIGQALAEQAILTGKSGNMLHQWDERTLRVVGELNAVETRLRWVYGTLPASAAAYWPTPPGGAAKAIHARRLELIAELDEAFSKSRLIAGPTMLAAILNSAPGPTLAESAVEGWTSVAYAVKNGGDFPTGFAEAWSDVVPAACAKYEGWGELAPFVARFS